ncbi:single-stranded DNA-binding protein [Methylobacterium gnaphalii]|uniref:Single-stranded DNA-binding protein n=1 Tax=Methylobacterium gnaphalii TaxID=1010610 RepID=A0A512JP96_9HYPH|nr:single-stranded DNA-binding protein [Methylobacterium gnaphalii]GEP11786.1 single-stranded DNA-binding protein [Methylobacterium gnaphalii]GJD69463.1 Single-stranded DNA-binding protein [Methylobacterium gnaphalii]GLS49579.1 single-stranded DNA-binding protein [Methylobacterium gnaphalii]
MYNKATLIGNLGADPEIRAMPSGDKVATLRLATSDTWKDKETGERKERTEWHRVTVFNQNLVRVIEQYAHKGDRLLIEGAIRTRKWTDQAGVEKFSTEIVLENFNGEVRLMTPPQRSAPSQDDYGSTRSREGSGERRPSSGAGGGGRPPYDLDDDIPF